MLRWAGFERFGVVHHQVTYLGFGVPQCHLVEQGTSTRGVCWDIVMTRDAVGFRLGGCCGNVGIPWEWGYLGFWVLVWSAEIGDSPPFSLRNVMPKVLLLSHLVF